MATNNAININKPIQVARGGTGNATLTAHGVLLGEGTNAINATAAGTNGQALVGSTSSDPAMATLGTDGSVIFTTGAASLSLTARMVQQVSTVSTSTALISTGIPFDNTIPQNTEGTQITTLSITPKNTNNTLYIIAEVQMSNSTSGDQVILALFQDSTANALNARYFANTGSNTFFNVVLTHIMTAGTTSSTTFKLRGGHGTGGNVGINESGAGLQSFGGVCEVIFYIYEMA